MRSRNKNGIGAVWRGLGPVTPKKRETDWIGAVWRGLGPSIPWKIRNKHGIGAVWRGLGSVVPAKWEYNWFVESCSVEPVIVSWSLGLTEASLEMLSVWRSTYCLDLETRYVAVNSVVSCELCWTTWHFGSDFSCLCRFHSSFAAVLSLDDFWFNVSSVNFGISNLNFQL